MSRQLDSGRWLHEWLPDQDDANIEGYWVPTPEEIEKQKTKLRELREQGNEVNPMEHDTLQHAIDLIFTNPQKTAAELDRRIETLERQLTDLRRVRRTLTGTQTQRSRGAASVDPDKLELILAAVAKGPLAPNAIAKSTGLNAPHIGRIAKASEKLTRHDDGTIGRAV